MILLCWNRDQGDTWPLGDYEDVRKTCERGEVTEGTWSVGNRVNISIGTECFLLIQGAKYPRGIVAQGITTSEPWEDEHYADPERTTNYVDIQWNSLLPIDDLIPVAILDRELPQIPWASGGIRGSGFRIRPEFQERLRGIWAQFSGEDEEQEPGEMAGGEYIEGGVRTIVVNRYERDPNARRACLAHHGYICFACDVDLSKIYGKEYGNRAIHVHHIEPMATRNGETYIVDPIKDLIPLCPNCHNVIHKTNPVRTPEQFREHILKNNWP